MSGYFPCFEAKQTFEIEFAREGREDHCRMRDKWNLIRSIWGYGIS